MIEVNFTGKYTYEPLAKGHEHVWKPVFEESGKEFTGVYPASAKLRDIQEFMEWYKDDILDWYECEDGYSFRHHILPWNSAAQDAFLEDNPTIYIS